MSSNRGSWPWLDNEPNNYGGRGEWCVTTKISTDLMNDDVCFWTNSGVPYAICEATLGSIPYYKPIQFNDYAL